MGFYRKWEVLENVYKTLLPFEIEPRSVANLLSYLRDSKAMAKRLFVLDASFKELVRAELNPATDLLCAYRLVKKVEFERGGNARNVRKEEGFLILRQGLPWKKFIFCSCVQTGTVVRIRIREDKKNLLQDIPAPLLCEKGITSYLERLASMMPGIPAGMHMEMWLVSLQEDTQDYTLRDELELDVREHLEKVALRAKSVDEVEEIAKGERNIAAFIAQNMRTCSWEEFKSLVNPKRDMIFFYRAIRQSKADASKAYVEQGYVIIRNGVTFLWYPTYVSDPCDLSVLGGLSLLRDRYSYSPTHSKGRGHLEGNSNR